MFLEQICNFYDDMVSIYGSDSPLNVSLCNSHFFKVIFCQIFVPILKYEHSNNDVCHSTIS